MTAYEVGEVLGVIVGTALILGLGILAFLLILWPCKAIWRKLRE